MLILYPPFLLTLLLLYCLRWRFEDTTAPPKYPLPYVQIKHVCLRLSSPCKILDLNVEPQSGGVAQRDLAQTKQSSVCWVYE
jgi:hypothetical protein